MDPFNDEYFMKQALVEARSAAEEGEVWPEKPSVVRPCAQAALAISCNVFLPSHIVEWQCTLDFL